MIFIQYPFFYLDTANASGPPGPPGPPGTPGLSSGVSDISPKALKTGKCTIKHAPACPQVTVLRSYDTMIATARRQAEGSLIYVIDRADLYLRVGNGLRQVMVR